MQSGFVLYLLTSTLCSFSVPVVVNSPYESISIGYHERFGQCDERSKGTSRGALLRARVCKFEKKALPEQHNRAVREEYNKNPGTTCLWYSLLTCTLK